MCYNLSRVKFLDCDVEKSTSKLEEAISKPLFGGKLPSSKPVSKNFTSNLEMVSKPILRPIKDTLWCAIKEDTRIPLCDIALLQQNLFYKGI